MARPKSHTFEICAPVNASDELVSDAVVGEVALVEELDVEDPPELVDPAVVALVVTGELATT